MKKLLLLILSLILSLSSLGFFRNRINKRIKEIIKEVYKTTNIPWDSRDRSSSELLDTNIHWEEFEKFAEKYGGETDIRPDGVIYTEFNIDLNMSGLHAENGSGYLFEREFRVTGVRNRLGGTTSIQVRKA
jgi:hypothetical protein